MLKLPHKYTDDKKADALIAWYLNRNILELVSNEIVNYETGRGKEAQEDDFDFCSAVRDFFPENYPAAKMGKAFLGLKALLESEYEFVPELVMEYVMYSLIKVRIKTADRLGIQTQGPLSCQRDYVVKALRREYPDERKYSDDGEDMAFLSWREELERIENLHYYENICFWDLISELDFEIHTEVYQEYGDWETVNQEFHIVRKERKITFQDSDRGGLEQEAALDGGSMAKLLRWIIHTLEVFMWPQDYG